MNGDAEGIDVEGLVGSREVCLFEMGEADARDAVRAKAVLVKVVKCMLCMCW